MPEENIKCVAEFLAACRNAGMNWSQATISVIIGIIANLITWRITTWYYRKKVKKIEEKNRSTYWDIVGIKQFSPLIRGTISVYHRAEDAFATLEQTLNEIRNKVTLSSSISSELDDSIQVFRTRFQAGMRDLTRTEARIDAKIEAVTSIKEFDGDISDDKRNTDGRVQH